LPFGLWIKARQRLLSTGVGTIACFLGLTLLSACANIDEQAVVSLPNAEKAGQPSNNLMSGYLAGRQGLQDGRYDLARPYLQQALVQDPSSRLLWQENLNLALAEGDVAAAAYNHQQLKLLGATSPNGQLAEMVSAVNQRDWKAANQAVDAMPNTELNLLLRPLLKAWLALAENDPAAARAALLTMPRTHPLSWLGEMQVGLVAWWLQDLPAAEASFVKALGQDRAPPLQLVESLATVLQQQGRVDEALALYDRLLEGQPDNSWLLQKRRALADGSPPAPPAAPWLQRPEDGIADLFTTMAMLLQDGYQFRDARLQYLQLSLSLNPKSETAQLQLARTLASFNRCPEALTIWSGVAADSPWNWTARIDEARCWEMLEKSDMAVNRLKKLASDQPKRYDIWLLLGDMQRDAKQFADALSSYQRAMTLLDRPSEPTDWPLFYAAGIAAEQAKNWPVAEEYFTKALALNPKQPSVLNYLGYSWIDQNRNLAQAEQLVQLALEQRPNDGYITDSLAWARYQQGDYVTAVTLLEKALSLVANDPMITDHYADALWQVGRTQEATYQWQRALLLLSRGGSDPSDAQENDALRVKIEGKLQRGVEKVGTLPAPAAPAPLPK
jgi:tetratricopeptide (TPR) repeat protein